MNNNKNNNAKTLVLAIIAVAAAGRTYAWWSWSSNQANANENTLINYTLEQGLAMKVVGTNTNGIIVAPTPACYVSGSTDEGYGYTLTSKVTVTASNETNIDAKTTFVLSAKLTPASGRTFGSGDKAHLHWAMAEVSNGSTGYASTYCSGTTDSATFAHGDFSSVTASATAINIPITFDVPAGTTAASPVTKYYHFYVWLDSGYNFTNVGSGSVTDPMQDATVWVSFDANTKIEQKTS